MTTANILSKSSNHCLACFIIGRAVVDDCLSQRKVIKQEGRVGVLMQVPGKI